MGIKQPCSTWFYERYFLNFSTRKVLNIHQGHSSDIVCKSCKKEEEQTYNCTVYNIFASLSTCTHNHSTHLSWIIDVDPFRLIISAKNSLTHGKADVFFVLL